MGTELIGINATISEKPHRVIVCPRVQAVTLVGPFDYIVMTSPDSDPVVLPEGAVRTLELFFDDVESGEKAFWGRPLVPMGPSQAAQVADFVASENLADTIVISCDGGVSRSAGVAAGILAGTANDDSEVFRRKCPNGTCRRLVMEAVHGRFEGD